MSFPLALDHVSVICRADAPEARLLESLGINGFGGVTNHGGLGTASTSFFFENAYLELLWVADALAAVKTFGPLGFDLQARTDWQATGASPFGLLLSRRPGAVEPIPFVTRSLQAEWMPGDVWLHFCADEPRQPYYGVVPQELAYASFQSSIPRQHHPLGVERLSAVCIAVADDGLSTASQVLNVNAVAAIEPGVAPLMTLTFDDGWQGRAIDCRPSLPLIMQC